MSLFLSGPHPPSVVSRGLYAGLKSFNGRHTSLPVVLDDDIYVNAGFIDGLNVALVSALQLKNVNLRVIFKGSLHIQWYFLDQHSEVRHFSDVVAKQTTKDNERSNIDLEVPQVLLTDESVRLVYFRILNNPNRTDSRPSHLINWCFHCEQTDQISGRSLLVVSRSLGDSRSVIERHLAHYQHYQDLLKTFADLSFLPMPVLDIYESDTSSYQASKELLSTTSLKHHANHLPIRLYRNKYNLGGGGNMYLALNNSLLHDNHKDDFAMVDSDTLIPFKTLYTTALISALSDTSSSKLAPIIAPVIAYRKQGTRVLEAGATFGRGTWNLYTNDPVQPCINPLYYSSDLSDKAVQAKLSRSLPTDYPPFIFSLYRMRRKALGKGYLPAPFFLRGDDVEYGLFLRDQGFNTEVLGSLLVFQDPKHSPWHEFMAILHATTILIAYCGDENLDTLKRNIYLYFRTRHDHHMAMRDLNGLLIYSNVLNRLRSILNMNGKSLLREYYDPNSYVSLRSLNSAYSEANYILASQVSDEQPSDQCIKLPFLYYDGLLNCSPLPNQVVLVNHLSETAAIFNPLDIESTLLIDASLSFMDKLSYILSNFANLRTHCKKLLDRKSIYELFSSDYGDAIIKT
jgi:GT2 family glycosyltransferase